MVQEPDVTGYEAVDRDGRRLGRILEVWEHADSGRPAFAAVKTGWLPGRGHVVPLADARADDAERLVWIPYPEDLVKDAPNVRPGDDLSPEDAQRAWDHYLQARDGERVEMPLFGERLRVRKRMVEQGGVRVRKETRREVVYEPVEVLREHVVVERLAPDEVHEAERRAQGRDDEIVLRERGEEPVFEAYKDLIGGVRATRHVDEETREVEAQRRVEDVETTREPPAPADEDRLR